MSGKGKSSCYDEIVVSGTPQCRTKIFVVILGDNERFHCVAIASGHGYRLHYNIIISLLESLVGVEELIWTGRTAAVEVQYILTSLGPQP